MNGLDFFLRAFGIYTTSTIHETPQHWNTKKGSLLKAIIFNGADTWNKLQKVTGYPGVELNKLLQSLIDEGVLNKTVLYQTSEELSNHYWDYQRHIIQKNINESNIDVSSLDIQSEDKEFLIEEIARSEICNNQTNYIEHSQAFLSGTDIHDKLQTIISMARKEILFVVPALTLDQFPISLMEKAFEGIQVVLVTNPPYTNTGNPDTLLDLHKKMRKNNVNIIYDSSVNGCVMIIDRAVGIINSGNSGRRDKISNEWSAAIITTQKSIVKSMYENIVNQF